MGPLWEGYHESRRCSRDTYPESYITKYTSIRRDIPEADARGGLIWTRRWYNILQLVFFEKGCITWSVSTSSSLLLVFSKGGTILPGGNLEANQRFLRSTPVRFESGYTPTGFDLRKVQFAYKLHPGCVVTWRFSISASLAFTTASPPPTFFPSFLFAAGFAMSEGAAAVRA